MVRQQEQKMDRDRKVQNDKNKRNQDMEGQDKKDKTAQNNMNDDETDEEEDRTLRTKKGQNRTKKTDCCLTRVHIHSNQDTNSRQSFVLTLTPSNTDLITVVTLAVDSLLSWATPCITT